MSYGLAKAVVCSTSADVGLVIFKAADGTWAMRPVGMAAEQLASVLYCMAEQVVDQFLPPPTDFLPMIQRWSDES